MSKYIDAEKLLSEIQLRKKQDITMQERGILIDVETAIESLQQEQPSLPSNLDEAAEEYAYTNWEDNDYHEGASEGLPFDAIGHTEKCFKAGAEHGFSEGYKSGKKDTIEKALKWITDRTNVALPIPTNDKGEPLADGYANYLKERQKVINQVESEFRKAMEE